MAKKEKKQSPTVFGTLENCLYALVVCQCVTESLPAITECCTCCCQCLGDVGSGSTTAFGASADGTDASSKTMMIVPASGRGEPAFAIVATHAPSPPASPPEVADMARE
jgi:hypothetical protein